MPMLSMGLTRRYHLMYRYHHFLEQHDPFSLLPYGRSAHCLACLREANRSLQIREEHQIR